jgi:mono/diheme cytochrome c family protein
MRYTRLFFVFVSFTLLMFAPGISQAEDIHATETPVASARPTADSKLSPEVVKALTKLFPIFTASAVRDRYGVSLPAAFDSLARSQDEDGMADFVTELFRTLNDKQVETLLHTAENAIADEKDKPRERQSQEVLRLLWRLKEAALDVQKKPGDPELADFRKAFHDKFEAAKKKNHDFYKLLKEAATNDAARKKLLEDYGDPEHPELFWRFLRDQCASGNKRLCDDMSNNLTFKDPQTGDHFFDVVNTANNHKGRVILGQGNDFENALTDLSKQTNGFTGLRFSTTQHETLEDPPLRSRAIANSIHPTPPGHTTPPAGPSITHNPAPLRRQLPGGETSPGTTTEQREQNRAPRGSDPSAPLQTKTAEVASIITSHCLGCHSGAHPPRGLAFNADGTIPGGKATIEKVIRRALIQKSMPPSDEGQLSTSELDSLRQWAQLQNIATQ